MQDSWDSVLHILDYFAANQDTFAAVAGPGAWNDPDQVNKVKNIKEANEFRPSQPLALITP